jgi:hypothetical protein
MGKMARKAKRRPKKPAEMLEAHGGQQIQLENPVANHFETFIVGNAMKCDRVAEMDSAKGQHIVICGAGPSLREHAAEYCETADQVWGCNSALVWLHENGHRVTHGFTVDQTPHMLEEWYSTPDVEYLLATSCHHHLTELLEKAGRRITFFHNYVGLRKKPVQMPDPEGGPDIVMPYEDWLYMAIYPETVKVGSGLNAVTRAWDLAYFMGASKITILGADCALKIKRKPPDAPEGSPAHMKWLREDTEMHADGGNALASGATQVTVEGEIDGRFWVTKPDMMISAVWMVRMARHFGDTVELVGDTLPNALKDKDEEYLDRLPALTDSRGDIVRYSPPQLREDAPVV